MRNLGLIGLKTVFGAYLQAHNDSGELHGGNPHRNEEETWFLFELDPARRLYALRNWRNGRFMSKRGACAPAISQTLGPTEQWIFVSGQPHNVLNAVAIQSAADGTFLGSNRPGDDTQCGGEVAAAGGGPIPANDGQWPGWWVIESAAEPSPGRDFWNTAGGALAHAGQQILNNIRPADVAALIAAL